MIELTSPNLIYTNSGNLSNYLYQFMDSLGDETEIEAPLFYLYNLAKYILR